MNAIARTADARGHDSEDIMTADASPIAEAIAPALGRWKQGIDDGDLELIATAFTADALFQGARPATLFGGEGVKEYYGSQPTPLTVDYTVSRLRPLSEAAAVAFLDATFHRVDLDDLPARITLVLEPIAGRWLISHYHVSLVA
jgi:hypothetical protein